MATDATTATDLVAIADNCTVGREMIRGQRPRLCLLVGLSILGSSLLIGPHAEAKTPCSKTRDCREYGRCEGWIYENRKSACRVSNRGCRQSTQCKRDGRCRAIRGNCRTASNRDCRQSHGCKEEGRCHLSKNKTFCEVSNQGCRASEVCENGGRCIARDGGCEVDEGERCRRSTWCKDAGHCTYKALRSPAARDPAFCWPGTSCPSSARVGRRRDRPPETCIVGKTADCRQSTQCKERGLCTYKDGACVVGSNKDCRRWSTQCKRRGHCAARDGRCVAVSRADCRRSSECRSRRTCLFSQDSGTCEVDTDCANSARCREEGFCEWVTGFVDGCFPGSDAHCRASAVCRKEGFCSVTDPCSDNGFCENEEYRANVYCRALTPADCAGSIACKRHGRCAAQEGHCVAKLSCASSEWCKEAGLCTAQGARCVATREGCQSSMVCKMDGRCALAEGRCSETNAR